jgi:hypothetical protein
MVSWAWPRKSYEARVLVVPIDDPSRAATEALGPNGLDGVSVLYPVASRRAGIGERRRPPGAQQ